MSYPTRIDLCDGKYSVIYDLEAGQSECLRYGEKWRDLCGDKMVLAMFDRIVELEAELRRSRTALEQAANVFGRYAMHHGAKTPPDTEKARANLDLARMCDEALTLA